MLMPPTNKEMSATPWQSLLFRCRFDAATDENSVLTAEIATEGPALMG